MKGFLGQKIGMTQVFTNHGLSIPVTIIGGEKNIVTSIFTQEKDGYAATQLGVFNIKKRLQKKAEIGHFKKAKTEPKKFVKEIRNMTNYNLGDQVDVSIFKPGDIVDVIGISKGKGFAGAIKRHNQKIGPKSHGGGGGSKPVRQTGSLGDISGNKVVKGMTMPGHLGHSKTTMQNLEVVDVNVENNVLLVKGSIPGANKSFVVVRNNIKQLKNKTPLTLFQKLEKEKNHQDVKNNLKLDKPQTEDDSKNKNKESLGKK